MRRSFDSKFKACVAFEYKRRKNYCGYRKSVRGPSKPGEFLEKRGFE